MKTPLFDSAIYYIDGKIFLPLRYQYKGYLGEHNKPPFKAQSLLYQSSGTPVHFHLCKN